MRFFTRPNWIRLGRAGGKIAPVPIRRESLGDPVRWSKKPFLPGSAFGGLISVAGAPCAAYPEK